MMSRFRNRGSIPKSLPENAKNAHQIWKIVKFYKALNKKLKLRSSNMSNRFFLRCFFVHEGKVHIDLKLTAEITFCTAKIQHIPVEIKNRNCVINSNRVLALHIINIFLNYQTRCWQREEKIWTDRPRDWNRKNRFDRKTRCFQKGRTDLIWS